MLLAAGCNSKPASNRVPVYPVDVKITYKGFPAAGAVVTLHPKTPRDGVPPPRAEVNKDGVVKVSTYDGGDGAPEGEYVVFQFDARYDRQPLVTEVLTAEREKDGKWRVAGYLLR